MCRHTDRRREWNANGASSSSAVTATSTSACTPEVNTPESVATRRLKICERGQFTAAAHLQRPDATIASLGVERVNLIPFFLPILFSCVTYTRVCTCARSKTKRNVSVGIIKLVLKYLEPGGNFHKSNKHFYLINFLQIIKRKLLIQYN